MSDQPRPVWLTEAQRDALDVLPSTDLLYDIVAAWDAAPADPAEAVLEALSAEWMSTGMGNEERIEDVYHREGVALYRRSAVLRALKYPSDD